MVPIAGLIRVDSVHVCRVRIVYSRVEEQLIRYREKIQANWNWRTNSLLESQIIISNGGKIHYPSVHLHCMRLLGSHVLEELSLCCQRTPQIEKKLFMNFQTQAVVLGRDGSGCDGSVRSSI